MGNKQITPPTEEEKEIVKSKNLNNEQKHNLFMDLNHLLRELKK